MGSILFLTLDHLRAGPRPWRTPKILSLLQSIQGQSHISGMPSVNSLIDKGDFPTCFDMAFKVAEEVSYYFTFLEFLILLPIIMTLLPTIMVPTLHHHGVYSLLSANFGFTPHLDGVYSLLPAKFLALISTFMVFTLYSLPILAVLPTIMMFTLYFCTDLYSAMSFIPPFNFLSF
jgi:hypothetical protein